MHIKRFIPSAKHWAEAKCSASVSSRMAVTSVVNQAVPPCVHSLSLSPWVGLLLAAALVHNHVFVVSEQHLAVLVVEHTERTHLGRSAAGRNHAVRVEMLQ